MFAATGWRVGWLIAPEWIISPTLAASTRIVFCSNSPMQEAVASGLEEAKKRRFFEIQLEEYQERRAILAEAFDRLGVRYTFPEGTYFMLLVSSQSPYYAGPFLTGVFRTCRILRGQKTTCSPSLCRAEVETSSAYLLHSHVCHLLIPYRACWFIATEIGVSSIPVSEVSSCCTLRWFILTDPASFTRKHTSGSVRNTRASRSARIRTRSIKRRNVYRASPNTGRGREGLFGASGSTFIDVLYV